MIDPTLDEPESLENRGKGTRESARQSPQDPELGSQLLAGNRS